MPSAGVQNQNISHESNCSAFGMVSPVMNNFDSRRRLLRPFFAVLLSGALSLGLSGCAGYGYSVGVNYAHPYPYRYYSPYPYYRYYSPYPYYYRRYPYYRPNLHFGFRYSPWYRGYSRPYWGGGWHYRR
jgi:hypothetical protein